MTLLLGVLAASVLGSVHCAAMCGAFACMAGGGRRAGGGGSSPTRPWRANVAYHGGRLLSYIALGVVAGGIGARVDDLGRLAGVGRAAAIVAGMLMVVWALDAIAASFGVRSRLARAPEWMQRAMGRVLRVGREAGETGRAFLIGLVTTLLPCGWLYTFVAVAGGTGSTIGGAAVMTVFWIGTVPMLLAVGAGAARLFGPLARRLPVASAVVVLVLGLLSIAGKLRTPVDGVHGSHTTHTAYVGR